MTTAKANIQTESPFYKLGLLCAKAALAKMYPDKVNLPPDHDQQIRAAKAVVFGSMTATEIADFRKFIRREAKRHAAIARRLRAKETHAGGTA